MKLGSGFIMTKCILSWKIVSHVQNNYQIKSFIAKEGYFSLHNGNALFTSDESTGKTVKLILLSCSRYTLATFQLDTLATFQLAKNEFVDMRLHSFPTSGTKYVQGCCIVHMYIDLFISVTPCSFMETLICL